MSASVLGKADWGLTRDKDGYRDYHIIYLIETTSTQDGPQTVLFTPGIPSVGSVWAFGNDLDDWVWAVPDTRIYTVKRGGPNDPTNYWILEQTFTNRPQWRCQDTNIENPLLEPPRLSGSYVKYVEEKRKGMDGKYFRSSSHELITGADVEFDSNRPTVTIEITSLTLPLGTITSMVDTVNDANLWGLSPRKIKLSNVSWRRLLWGVCTFYYVVTLEFDVNFQTFDRVVADMGTRELRRDILKTINPNTGNPYTPLDTVTKWTTPDNKTITFPTGTRLMDIPQAFDLIRDKSGFPLGWHHLNGRGQIWYPDSGDPPGEITLKYYPESNFLLLGIPTTLGT